MNFGLREVLAIAAFVVLYGAIDWVVNQMRLSLSTARGKDARDMVRLASVGIAAIIGAIVWVSTPSL